MYRLKKVVGAYYNSNITYERWWLDNVLVHRHLWLHFYYRTIDRVFRKTLRKSIFEDSSFFSFFFFMDLAKSHLILKEQYVRKFTSLKYVCRNQFSLIGIILNVSRKLTFLFQLFLNFRENKVWPMKAKSATFPKIFFRETL